MTLPLIETPRFMTPEAIADMQRLFRNYWRVECRPNPRNKNIVTAYLVRGPACPFYKRIQPLS